MHPVDVRLPPTGFRMTVHVYVVGRGAGAGIEAADAAVGGLADVGTSAQLVVSDGEQDLPGAVALLCATAGDVRMERVALDGGRAAGRLRERLEAHAANDPVFAVLSGGGEPAQVVVAGPDLPSMGRAPACGLAELEASLRYALGDLKADAGSLFTERASPPAGDARLMERLRQLYGD
jgi:hypothetical protein